MRATLAKVALLIAALVAVGFIVVVANQTAQLVFLADSVAPWLGRIVLWTLLTLYTFCVAVPSYLLLRLPKPLRAPPSDSDPSFEAHLDQLRGRLSTNPHLLGQPLSSRQDVETAARRRRLAGDDCRQPASLVARPAHGDPRTSRRLRPARPGAVA